MPLRLLAELKRRNVIRMAGLYLVGAWLIVQVAETLLSTFETPGWVLKVLVVLLAIGFVPALVFSWIYELTPEGLKRDADVSPTQSIAATTARRMDRLLLLGMIAVIGVVVADRYWPTHPQSAATLAPDASPSSSAVAAPAPPTTGDAAVASAPTIAVLPFVNMSTDEEQGYFSDGITEEIINALVKVPGVLVAARTSVFAFKDQHGDVRAIGKQLGVSHVLEGSVRSSGDAVRITAQLIRVDTGLHLWSEKFDRQLSDVFAIQDEIANAIADRLATSFSHQIRSLSRQALPGPGKRIDAVPQRAASMEAYDLFLRGRTYLRQRDEQQALHWLRQATEADPTFAPAWASLAICYQSFGRDDEAEPAARKALAIDADNVDALIALASVHRDRFEWFEAEAMYEQARALDPQSSNLLENTAEFYGAVADFKRMLEESTRGFRLDPLLAPLRDVHISALILNDRLEEALQLALDVDANVFWAGPRAVEILLLRGETELAIRQIERIGSETGGDFASLVELLRRPETPGALAALMEQLRSADSDTLGGAIDSQMRETIAAVVGDPQAVLQLTLGEGGRRMGAHEWYWLPALAPTRASPDFAALVKSLRLPEWWAARGWPAFCRPVGADGFECS